MHVQPYFPNQGYQSDQVSYKAAKLKEVEVVQTNLPIETKVKGV